MSEMIDTNPSALSPTEEVAVMSTTTVTSTVHTEPDNQTTDACNNATRDAENNVQVYKNNEFNLL
jgi:hypothetical protein